MPKILPAPQRLDALVEVIHAAHAHRVVVGFLVAREAGLTHQHSLSPIGNELMSRWVRARNLPRMIKDFQPHAQLMYRLRALCLQLHHHPASTVCGGPEQWWQRILEEGILCAICEQIAPQLFPELSPVKPRNRATISWWMRRGVNPVNPDHEPATWALIEGVQSRLFRGRGETVGPSHETPLPLAALNGAMSLHRRKALLANLTGSQEGWVPYRGIELYRDWSEVLLAWQAMGKESCGQSSPQRYTAVDIQRFETLAVVIHDALIPSWWGSRRSIRTALDEIGLEKTSQGLGSESLEKSSRPALETA